MFGSRGQQIRKLLIRRAKCMLSLSVTRYKLMLNNQQLFWLYQKTIKCADFYINDEKEEEGKENTKRTINIRSW
jgi:hypothetical protein